MTMTMVTFCVDWFDKVESRTYTSDQATRSENSQRPDSSRDLSLFATSHNKRGLYDDALYIMDSRYVIDNSHRGRRVVGYATHRTCFGALKRHANAFSICHRQLNMHWEPLAPESYITAGDVPHFKNWLCIGSRWTCRKLTRVYCPSRNRSLNTTNCKCRAKKGEGTTTTTTTKLRRRALDMCPHIQIRSGDNTENYSRCDDSIAKHALQWMPHGHRGRGRPKNTVWKRDLEQEMWTAGYK